MNTTDLTRLPALFSLEQYKDGLLDAGRMTAKFALADAQLVIASEHGFESWPRFAKHIEGLARESSTVSKLE